MYGKYAETLITPLISAAFVLTAAIEFNAPFSLTIISTASTYIINAFYRWRLYDSKEDVVTLYVLPIVIRTAVIFSIFSLIFNSLIAGAVVGIVCSIAFTIYCNK